MHQCMFVGGTGVTGAEGFPWNPSVEALINSYVNAPVLWFLATGVSSEEEKVLTPKTSYLSDNNVHRPTLVKGSPVYPVILRFPHLSLLHCSGCTGGRALVYPVAFGCTGAYPPVYLVTLNLPDLGSVELELILTSSFCSSKCFVEFFWAILDWIEQVCIVSKAKTIRVKLLTREPLLIVRSLTLNL